MKTLGLALLSFVMFMTVTARAAESSPDQVVQKATDHLQALLKKNAPKYKADTALFYRVVEDTTVPYFDTRYIAQLVMGRNWRGASPEQRTRFESGFKNMLIRTYANALLEYYNSVQIEWKPTRLAPDATDATVNSTLLREGKPPVQVAFTMHNTGNGWKIYDIVVENISLVSNFRSQVDSEAKRTSLEDVIVRLESGAYNQKTELESKN
jgi:phospholipid transport system substrate-binding protein